MTFKQLLEPPNEYYLLDCEFATELNLQSKEIRIVPLEIAIGHYLNGKRISCLLAQYAGTRPKKRNQPQRLSIF